MKSGISASAGRGARRPLFSLLGPVAVGQSGPWGCWHRSGPAAWAPRRAQRPGDWAVLGFRSCAHALTSRQDKRGDFFLKLVAAHAPESWKAHLPQILLWALTRSLTTFSRGTPNKSAAIAPVAEITSSRVLSHSQSFLTIQSIAVRYPGRLLLGPRASDGIFKVRCRYMIVARLRFFATPASASDSRELAPLFPPIIQPPII